MGFYADILHFHVNVALTLKYCTAKFYVAKNVLNQFRQDHGYKEGTLHQSMEWGKKITK